VSEQIAASAPVPGTTNLAGQVVDVADQGDELHGELVEGDEDAVLY
jgi:hypothetical protein